MLILIFLTALFDAVSATSTYPSTYANIQINATWSAFCTQESSFRSGLANLISYKTQIVTRSSELIFLNSHSSCSNAQLRNDTVSLDVTINHPYPKSDTQNLEMVKKMVSIIEKGVDIRGLKVITARLVVPIPEENGLSTNTVLIIIGVVLVVYVLGFFCILGTQSNDDDEKPAPQAYMVSTVNKGFRKRDAIDGVYFIGDDKIKH